MKIKPIISIIKIIESTPDYRESILFPLPEDNDGRISSFALLKNYLVYATDVSREFLSFLLD